MFCSENCQFSKLQEHAKKAASRNGRAFLCLCNGRGSASEQDVTKVASFFCFKSGLGNEFNYTTFTKEMSFNRGLIIPILRYSRVQPEIKSRGYNRRTLLFYG